MFAIARMVGGQPDIDQEATPIKGYVLCDQVANFGAYLFSGTGAQLSALDALPQVVGICAVTENGNVKWAELDGVVAAGVRTKLNTWITNNRHAWPLIPAGTAYRQILQVLYKRFNGKFDLSVIDVAD